MKTLPFLALLCVISPPTVQASQEQFLPWASVVIKSAFRAETGVVTVSAATRGSEFSALSIEAFGRITTFSEADLKKLSGCLLTTCLLTHEAGYPSLGGQTVHLRLKRPPDASSGQVKEQQILVSVPKNAPPEITVR